MMLHQQDNNLLLLNPSAKNSIFKVDLNRADIVEEWVGLPPRFLLLPASPAFFSFSEHFFLFLFRS
jgi:hypothetical protein